MQLIAINTLSIALLICSSIYPISPVTIPVEQQFSYMRCIRRIGVYSEREEEAGEAQ